jgi:UDP-N-acetylglucosamine 2-epimerase
MTAPLRVLSVVGTRPEAIKMAPVVKELEKHPDQLDSVLVSTAQHREMLDQTLAVFGIRPQIDLDIMRAGQSLTDVTTAVLARMGEVLAGQAPDLVLVQGDTTTALAAALAAFYAKIPVGHVEAGLRSHDPLDPYPEEMNRRLVDAMAAHLFAPTPRARANLLAEGVAPGRIAVTGNTVIDALRYILACPCELPPEIAPPAGGRLVLVTSHRRENWDEPLGNICGAMQDLVAEFPDIRVVWPVHLNPNVRGPVLAALQGVERIHLIPPVDYLALVHLMQRSYCILTDSGGIQEEAPSLGKPVLVLRRVTERPEACEAGLAQLVGTRRADIVKAAAALLRDQACYRAMSRAANPFGDGTAAAQIVRVLRGLPPA